MRFILEVWPDVENPDDPKELLRYAIESARENPSLVWDIEDDNGRPLWRTSLEDE